MQTDLLNVLPAMLLGAQLIVTLVLSKGEICPGQRGRIHKLIPALVALWVAASLNMVEGLAIAGGLMYFYSQVQTNKTREKGPLWLLHVGNLAALVLLLLPAASMQAYGLAFYQVLIAGYTGALFAHLMLVVARTRLQAFHRILPVSGILIAMGLALSLLYRGYQLDEQLVKQLTPFLLIGFLLLVSSILSWCWHLISHKSANKWQVGFSVVNALAAVTLFSRFYH